MTNWRTVQLKDVAAEVTVGFVGKMASEYTNSGITFLRSFNIEPFRINLAETAYISADFHTKISKSALHPGDVVVVRTGNPGVAAIVPEDLGPANCSDLVIIRPGDALDGQFLVYYLNSITQKIVSAHTVGAVQQHFNVGAAKDLKINLPSLDEQRQISTILGLLDQKIDLNNRMNRTLESLSQTLFHDRFWMANERTGILKDIAQIVGRSVNPSEVSEQTPYIGLEHMPKHSIALTEWSNAGAVDSNKTAFRQNDFLFGKLRPYFHKVGVAPIDGICSTDIVVLAPIVPIWWSFTLMCISSEEFVSYTMQRSTGTKMPRTSWNEMGKFPVPLPTESKVAAFDGIVRPWISLLQRNIFENQALSKMRDFLLPKLITGAISIKQVTKELEQVL